MQDSIQIRPAQPADAEVAALLLRSAYTHTQVAYPPPEDPESGWGGRLQRYFRQEGNRFSYQNTFVAQHSAQVVGLVLAFGGQDEARLNAAVGPWLEREAQDDEWYVDALAVFTNWGRRGIGTRLMRAAEPGAPASLSQNRAECRAREHTGIGSVYASRLCRHAADNPL